MPRANGKSNQPTPKSEERRLIYAQFGAYPESSLADWDPKGQKFSEALLQVVADGATVVLRPGSGGRSVGIAIWEGDVRHAPQWCYEAEEIDQWADAVLAVHQRETAD